MILVGLLLRVFQYLRGNDYLKGSNSECNPADSAFKESECDEGDYRTINEAYPIPDGWTVKDGGHQCGIIGGIIIFFSKRQFGRFNTQQLTYLEHRLSDSESQISPRCY